MKSLNDIAIAYKDSALRAINPGVPFKGKTVRGRAYFNSRAVKDGNLFSQVASSNTIKGMTKLGKDKKSFTLTFNIAPNGAPYGKYVHNGTWKMAPRPFGEIAGESKSVKEAFDMYMNQVVESELETTFENMEDMFLKAGFKVK